MNTKDDKKLRNLKEEMPSEEFCPLCGLINVKCECRKYNCFCDILAINCEWPICLCKNCLNLKSKCVCSDE